MKNILIHGLGQNNRDWDTIKTVLEARGISSIAPDLFDLARGRKLDYPTVYQAFSELCESYKDKGSYRNKRKPEAYLLLFCESTVSKTRHW